MEWYLQVLLRRPHGGQGFGVVHPAIPAVVVVDEESNARLRGRVINPTIFHVGTLHVFLCWNNWCK